jgi:hypothetical protein
MSRVVVGACMKAVYLYEVLPRRLLTHNRSDLREDFGRANCTYVAADFCEYEPRAVPQRLLLSEGYELVLLFLGSL